MKTIEDMTREVREVNSDPSFGGQELKPIIKAFFMRSLTIGRARLERRAGLPPGCYEVRR